MTKLIVNKTDSAVQKIYKSDPVLAQLIEKVGDIEINLREDYFASLVRSIVGQQISVKAASTIYVRLKTLLDHKLTAEKINNVSLENLRSAGLTNRKAEYVKDLAKKVLANELDLKNIEKYNDEEIIEQLITVKGIGKWTAEVFLLLTLGRKDVLAIDDVGIQRAAKWLYQIDKSERRQILIDKSPLWKPHRSIVSFYLWEAIHLGFLDNNQTIEDVYQARKDVSN